MNQDLLVSKAFNWGLFDSIGLTTGNYRVSDNIIESKIIFEDIGCLDISFGWHNVLIMFLAKSTV